MRNTATACPPPFFLLFFRTGPPLRCATHKNNNVPNKVHRWKIAGPQWENTYNTRINSANDVEWPALPVINSSRAVNQPGRVAMDVSLPRVCWELIKLRPSDAVPYSADKISPFPQRLPPKGLQLLGLSSGCRRTTASGTAGSFFFLPPLPRTVWVRNCPQPITSRVGGPPLLLQTADESFALTCHYCTYDPARQWIAAARARQPGRLCRDREQRLGSRATLRRWHATTRPRRISWTKWCPERRRARAARGAGAAAAASSSWDYSSCRCACTPSHSSATWTSAPRSGGRSSSRSETRCWHWRGLTRLTRRWRSAARGRRLTWAVACKLLR